MRHRAITSVICSVLVAAACTASDVPGSPVPTLAASPVSIRADQWAEDIRYLAEEMERIHPDLFHGVPAATFHRAVDELVAAAPTLNDDELLVGAMRLVAMISTHGRDGHMGMWPPDNPDAIDRFPIRVWEFPDGLYITAARAPNGRLVGSRILRIDGLPVHEVLERVDPVVPRDTESNLRDARTVFLTSAEVLSGLGIADASAAMTLKLETVGGEHRSETIDAIDAQSYADWVGGWELLLPERPGLAFLQDAGAPFHVTYLESSRTAYVRYNAVGEHSFALVAAIRSSMRGHSVDRIVLDLRSNGGGEAGGFRELLRFLASEPLPLDVLIGRLTFSAASSLVVSLAQRVPATVLIGETMGGAPDFWANTTTVTLPNSGLVALVSQRHVRSPIPNDHRMQVDPDINVPLSASDYFHGRDPVLRRAGDSP